MQLEEALFWFINGLIVFGPLLAVTVWFISFIIDEIKYKEFRKKASKNE
jgi:uncharacterized membrane protein